MLLTILPRIGPTGYHKGLISLHNPPILLKLLYVAKRLFLYPEMLALVHSANRQFYGFVPVCGAKN